MMNFTLMSIGKYPLRGKCSGNLLSVPVAFSLLLLATADMMRMRVCASSFDIREHLSTKAPYIHRVKIKGAPSLYDTPDPAGYKPVFMYLLARHGSRWPTEKRMKQINSLQQLFKSIDSPAQSWMRDWTSPVAHFQYLAGDLHPVGEAEMLDLATRLKKRFPQLTNGTYAPKRYPIISTQVPRAAQSASAFALSFFSRPAYDWRVDHHRQQQKQHGVHTKKRHKSGANSSSGNEASRSWLPQPVAINMLPKKHDPILRFFESCKGYVEHEDRALRWLAPWMHGHWMKVVPGLEQRLGLSEGSLNTCHVDALWQLCAFEAGLGLGTFDIAEMEAGVDRERNHSGGNRRKRAAAGSHYQSVCQLFTEQDAQLLEWVEDVRLYEAQGYGAAVNYEIAAPLLADIASALTSAAAADASGRQPLQRARLMFAHCETLTPLATLMGLFKPHKDEASIIPRLPETDALQEAVGISSKQVEQDLAAADSMEDLPLVILQTDQTLSSQQQQHHIGQPEMPESQEPWLAQQKHRRRLLSGSNIDSSSSDSLASSATSTETPQQQHQQQQRPLSKHHHGPDVVGCSYKGRDPLDASLLLPPPEDWSPGFNLDDPDRVWRGGRVAPLGANLLLVLYGKTDSSSSSSSGADTTTTSSSGGADRGLYFGDYRVRLVYNEQVIQIPGCGNGLDCSLEQFLEVAVGNKASRERFRQHCSSSSPHLEQVIDTAAVGKAGSRAQQLLFGGSFSSNDDVGEVDTSSTSSSSTRSSSSGQWGGNSEVELSSRGAQVGLELTTADGLPLVLTDGVQGWEGAKLWY